MNAGVSARTYVSPFGEQSLLVEDIGTTVGLIVADAGVAMVLGTNFTLEPGNAIGSTGEPWPYYRIVPLLRSWTGYPGQSISVTARWGWPTVPPLVVEATILVLMDLYATKDLRFGVLSPGFDGGFSQRIRSNTMAMTLLAPYIRADVMMGIA